MMIRLPSAQLCCTFYQPQQTNCAKMLRRPNPFCRAKRACFETFSSSFNVQDHILNIAGDALRLPIGPKQCCFYTSTYFGVGLCLLNCPKAPPKLLKFCILSRSQQSSIEFIGFDYCTSSKIPMQGHILSDNGNVLRKSNHK